MKEKNKKILKKEYRKFMTWYFSPVRSTMQILIFVALLLMMPIILIGETMIVYIGFEGAEWYNVYIFISVWIAQFYFVMYVGLFKLRGMWSLLTLFFLMDVMTLSGHMIVYAVIIVIISKMAHVVACVKTGDWEEWE